MIKNYLKIAFRNLAKYKVYTIINALGLSIGIGSCLFILVLTQNELSFDNYHENKARIYRLTDVIRVSSDRTLHTASTPAPWGPTMHNDYPEIENYVRYLIRRHAVRNNDNLIKVLGASLQNIITMLSSEFMKLVLVANIIAWPLAYFGMRAWLQNFAYHVDVALWIFLVCGAIALAIAWLTICYQAIKAALANPVKSLRYE